MGQMTHLFMERIRRNRAVANALAELCEFSVNRRREDDDWYRIKSSESFQVIAGDGSGGAFLAGTSGLVLYMSSEGRAGVLAPSLPEAVAMFVALPYWQSLLKFSAGGDLAEMKRGAAYYESDLQRNTADPASQRQLVSSALTLLTLPDPVASLHSAVSTLGVDVVVEAPDGNCFASLFNTFTVDDYLRYRKA